MMKLFLFLFPFMPITNCKLMQYPTAITKVARYVTPIYNYAPIGYPILKYKNRPWLSYTVITKIIVV